MQKTKWLLVGGDSLAGREIASLVESRKLPVQLTLTTAELDKRVVSLRADDEDYDVMQPLDASLVADSRVLLLCGEPDVNRKALALAHAAGVSPFVVDVAGTCEDLPESRLRAPLVESGVVEAGGVHTLAHPAAVALARVLSAVDGGARVKQACANVFEPASELGKDGVDELHQQVLSLFNFKALPQAVFDTQVSFNLLPRRGAAARVSLESCQQRMERHLASLLGPRGTVLPSLRLIQAPVFHAYTISLWLEFESRPAPAEVCRWLSEAGLEVRGADVETASNVSVASQSGVAVSDVAEDHSSSRAMWLWVAFDNVFALAENAVLTAGLLSRGGSRA